MVTGQICMEKHVIAKTVFFQRIVLIVALIRIPVIIQLLRAEHQHRLVPVLVVFNDGQSCECLTKTYAISENTSVVCFQFVNDGKGSIFLEVIELVPDLRRLKACGLIWKHIFTYVIQKLPEDIVERDKIDEVRRILTIHVLNIFYDGLCHICKIL